MELENITKEWLEEKYCDEKMSCYKIGLLLGVSGGRVNRKIKSLGININDRIYNRNKYLNSKTWLTEHYFDKNMSLSQMAALCGAKTSSVRYAFSRFGIKPRTQSEAHACSREDDYFISSGVAKEVIEGSLLGDASICRAKKKGIPSGNPYFTKTNLYKDHIECVARLIFYKDFQKRIFKVKPHGPKKTCYNKIINGNKNGYWQVKTFCHKDLLDMYQKWYIEGVKKDNVKLIPDDLTITPITLLHWFLDDGYSSLSMKKYKNPKYNEPHLRVELCTNGFSERDVDKLVYKLKTDLNIESKKSARKIARDGAGVQYVIRIVESSHDLFFNTIGPCPCSSLSYKWKKANKQNLRQKRWWEMFNNLKAFVQKNGCFPKSTVVKCGHEYKLYQWLNTQRMAKAHTINILLSDEKVKALETIPNWKWR